MFVRSPCILYISSDEMHTLVLEVEIIKAQVIVKRATKNNGIETIIMQKNEEIRKM